MTQRGVRLALRRAGLTAEAPPAERAIRRHHSAARGEGYEPLSILRAAMCGTLDQGLTHDRRRRRPALIERRGGGGRATKAGALTARREPAPAKAGGSREPGPEAHAQRATGGGAARRPVRGRSPSPARSIYRNQARATRVHPEAFPLSPLPFPVGVSESRRKQVPQQM